MWRRIISVLVVLAVSILPVVGHAQAACVATSVSGTVQQDDAADFVSAQCGCDKTPVAPCDITTACLNACAMSAPCAVAPLDNLGFQPTRGQVTSFLISRFLSVPIAPDTGPPRA